MGNANKIMVIVNPVSGSGTKDGLSQRLGTVMRAAGYEFTLIYTRSAGHATELARRAVDEDYHAVIACGGDGTVNETARALCGTRVILGIIPSGSGNGLARHLGIPTDFEQALDIITHGHVINADYALANGRPFFCTFGVGYDAVVSHKFAKNGHRGMMKYFKCAVSEYAKYKPETYAISANGKILTQEALLVACCNASQWGNNAYIAPTASVQDGLLDVVIVHRGSLMESMLLGVDLFTGYIDKNTQITTFKAPSAVIYRGHDGPAHIDGEPIELGDIIEVKCRHKGLRIYAPEEQKFQPILTPAWNIFFSLRRFFTKE